MCPSVSIYEYTLCISHGDSISRRGFQYGHQAAVTDHARSRGVQRVAPHSDSSPARGRAPEFKGDPLFCRHFPRATSHRTAGRAEGAKGSAISAYSRALARNARCVYAPGIKAKPGGPFDPLQSCDLWKRADRNRRLSNYISTKD